MKKTFLLCFVVFSVLLFAACQPEPTKAPELPPTNTPEIKASPTVEKPVQTPVPTNDPSIITAGNLEKGVVLDPALSTDAAVLDVCASLYSGLVTLDAGGNVAPALATSWSVSDDELDIVFTLRRDATFSDGTPIDADVIVENFYRWFDPANPLHGAGTYQGWKDNFLGFLGEMDADGKPIAIVDGLEKVDDFTVLLHLNRRDPDMLKKLAQPHFGILSPDALKLGNYGASLDSIRTSGPYQVEAWDEAQLLLVPDQKFWGEQPDQKMKFDVH